MEAVYFGNAKGGLNHGGAGTGPWIMADMENVSFRMFVILPSPSFLRGVLCVSLNIGWIIEERMNRRPISTTRRNAFWFSQTETKYFSRVSFISPSLSFFLFFLSRSRFGTFAFLIAFFVAASFKGI